MNGAQKKQRLQAISESPSYIRAYEDVAFLQRKDLRPIRLQLELLKPELILAEQGIRSTIVVFGGTRIVESSEARARVEHAKGRLKAEPGSRDAARELEVAKRVLAKSKYYDEAREFGRIVSSSCQTEGRCEYVVVTGGGPGVMEAANRGAFDEGGKSIGLNIVLQHEQAPNPYITPELCFQFHYFGLRKMHFLMRSVALVCFPGGFGTLDEMFEALTLIQTGKSRRRPVLLFGRAFWTRLINFELLVETGMISALDLQLFRFVETAEEAWSVLEAEYGFELREHDKDILPNEL